MHGTGHADVLVVLQMPGNKADAVPCERLLLREGGWSSEGCVRSSLRNTVPTQVGILKPVSE
jgi:hypothetical protein